MKRRLIDGVILVNLILYACASLYLYHSWQDIEDDNVVMTQNLAKVIEDQISDTIDKSNISLLTLKDLIEKQLENGGFDIAAINSNIETIQSRFPDLDSIRVADAKGDVLKTFDVTSTVNIADRDYFVHLKDNSTEELVFGRPVVGRISKVWVLNIGRRLNRQDGSFAGVVLAQLTENHLSKTFSKLNVGKKGSIALRTTDLDLVARYPETKGMVTEEDRKRVSNTFRELVASGRHEATFKARYPIDNIERLYTFHRIGNYPLVINVGRSTSQYMVSWLREAAIISLFLLFFSFATFKYARMLILRCKAEIQVKEELRRANEQLEMRVTERTAELSEKNLEFQKSEERYRTVADFTNDWEFWISPEGNFLYISPSCEAVTGYTRDEFIGDHQLLERIIHPDDRQMYEGHRHLVGASGNSESIDFRIITREGEERWIGHRCRQVFDKNGNGIGWRASNRDITDKVLIEKQLRAASLYTRSLIEASLDPLVTIGPDGRITDVNSSTETVTGHSRADLINTDFSNYFTDPELARAGYRQVFRNGQVRDYPLEIRHRYGHITPVLYNASLYRDEVGNTIGIFAAARDITELKRMEENLRSLNAELDQRVALRTAELERLNRELESFCYSISHELRAPLARLEGFSEAIIESVAENNHDESAHFAERIGEACRRLRSVIDSLLLLNRLSRVELQIEPVNLSEMARQTMAELNEEASGRSLKTIIVPDIIAQGDRNLLSICLKNLLGNAVKYTARNPDAVIEFGESCHSGEMVFFVRDNGVGFDMAFADKLFEPFCRLHQQSEFEGSGVGLPIVQRIIERHNGRIWADASEGNGATFYFNLPLHAAETRHKETNESLHRIIGEKTAEIRATELTSLEALATLAEYNDKTTGRHLNRIRYYAILIARKLSENPKYKPYLTISSHYVEDLSAASLLHDIGKTVLPSDILTKPDRYTTLEFEQMKVHTVVAGDFLARGNRNFVTQYGKDSYLALARDIAFCHHEKWDGTGYPKGLKGEDIPLSARILALADVYDAMRSKRPYRDALSHEKTVEAIQEERNAHFDPDVVDAFMEIQEEFRRVADMEED